MSTHSGITYQIDRLNNLRDRLVNKLRTMNLLNSAQHDLADAVIACRNIDTSGSAPNLQSRIVTLDNTAPPFQTPSSGYTGFSALSFFVDSNWISPDKILQGHSIVGVQGTAVTAHDPRRYSWDVPANKSNSITVTHNGILPKFEELFVFRKGGGCTYEKPEIIYGFYNKTDNTLKGIYLNTHSTTSGAQVFHMGNSSFKYSYSADGKSLTITSALEAVFNGNYVLYYYY